MSKYAESDRLALMKILSLNIAFASFILIPLGCAPSPVSEQKLPLKNAPAKATFTSKKYGFSLYLSSQPKIFSRPMPEAEGGIIEVFVTIPNPVSYLAIPVNLLDDDDEVKLSQLEYFDSVQKGIIEVSKGKLLGASDEKINGQDTRILTYSFALPSQPNPLFGETHLYRIGKRSYQFTAYVPQSQLKAKRAQMNKVFGSIVLTK